MNAGREHLTIGGVDIEVAFEWRVTARPWNQTILAAGEKRPLAVRFGPDGAWVFLDPERHSPAEAGEV